MADNKSCEDKYRIWKCVECGSRFGFPINDYKQDGFKCRICQGIVVEDEIVHCGVDFSTGRDLSVRMDFSESIKGLKAIQSEARKATSSLKEFEQAYNKTKSIADECNVSSQELLAILAKGRGDLHE